MHHYLIYFSITAFTVLLPGPGVLLTLHNSMQKNTKQTLTGILGISVGIFLVGLISATSLGLILSKSMIAFTCIKILGSIYLMYLGIKMFKKTGSNLNLESDKNNPKSVFSSFSKGLIVSLSNPKAIVFFMSVFPQFINLNESYTPQFLVLTLTYSFLIIIIHAIYAISASFAQNKLLSKKGNAILNKVCGSIFIIFGITLAASNK